MLDLDPDRATVAPRDAATVVVVRGGRSGVEVLCVRRHVRSGFLGGAVVFPGGKVDETDAGPGWAEATTGLPAGRVEEPGALRYAVAALRELLEEAGLAVVGGDGLAAGRVEELGELVRQPGGSLLESLRALALRLDTARLVALARWVTPTAEQRRFDTRFYLIEAPAGQVARHDEHETTESFWATPGEVLARWEAGDVMLAPPTSHTLTLLTRAGSVADALALARAHPLEPICPHFALDGADAVLALPGDPLHPSSVPVLRGADAPSRFVLTDGRFVPRRAGAT